MQRERGGAPEHIRSILTRLLSDLEREMTQDFNPNLSSKIDEVVFLIDFLNWQVAPALIDGCPTCMEAFTSDLWRD
jgi:hypothetical protein